MTGRFRWEVPPPPSWMSRHDALNQVFERAEDVMTSGTLVWGLLFMANSRLYERGNDEAAPAGVLYSFDPYLREHPEALRGIGGALYEMHEPQHPKPQINPWLRAVQDDLLTGMRRPFHDRIPPEISGPFCVYQSSVLLWPEHLPGGYLESMIHPLLIGSEGTNLALPHDLWPER